MQNRGWSWSKNGHIRNIWVRWRHFVWQHQSSLSHFWLFIQDWPVQNAFPLDWEQNVLLCHGEKCTDFQGKNKTLKAADVRLLSINATLKEHLSKLRQSQNQAFGLTTVWLLLFPFVVSSIHLIQHRSKPLIHLCDDPSKMESREVGISGPG